MGEHYSLTVNGRKLDVRDSWVGESLLYVLRQRLGLPGTKGACEQGECGSCTVLVDNQAMCSCLVMAATCTSSQITTVEGLADGDALTDVQQAFVEAGGVQCGFCTPGLIVAVHNLLESNPTPTGTEVKEALSGNICRCTGYGRIFDAVQLVVSRRAGTSS